MVTIIFISLVLLAMAGVFITHYVRYRGKRIVTCPETQTPVGAEVNAALAAGTWIVSRPRYVVTACSRWPERAGCDQACAPQIETSPEETLVRNIVAHWYEERTCVYCKKPIRELGGAVVPALLSLSGELCEWKDVAAEKLPSTLAQSVAVCARCELVEDFRRRNPNLVLNGTARPQQHRRIAEASSAVY
jgi:hypothetical protein